MREQVYVLKDKDFELIPIFECGQCFRWNKQMDDSYLGIFENNIIKIQKKEDVITFTGICEENIQCTIEKYFDLATDYKAIRKQLSHIDTNMKKSVEYGKGIRLLNQEVWEALISFIISANNNIPRIKGIIERLATTYGTPIQWQGTTYYTFPNPEQLSKASIEDLRKLGLGFRDKRVFETTQMVVKGEITLEELKQEKDSNLLKEKLMRFSGVGEKVAECIMLFALKKWEVFPIDVWVRRVMNELYIKNQDETKVDKKEIQRLAKEKYGNLAGIAQQYLFYWKREEKKAG